MKLTLAAKNEALQVILKKAFAPKFNKMLEAATAEFVSYLHNEHAHFFKAIADKNINQYIAYGFGCNLEVPHDREEKYVDFVRPCYGLKSYLPEHSHEYHAKHNRVCMHIGGDIKRPHSLTTFHTTVPKNYFKTWNDYIAAQSTLSRLFDSYSTVEKLVLDFPEYSSYFPKNAPVKKNLPMVQVGEIRGNLSALGIPAE